MLVEVTGETSSVYIEHGTVTLKCDPPHFQDQPYWILSDRSKGQMPQAVRFLSKGHRKLTYLVAAQNGRIIAFIDGALREA